jgi:Zn ribbon nucleic-acid-binding protein
MLMAPAAVRQRSYDRAVSSTAYSDLCAILAAAHDLADKVEEWVEDHPAHCTCPLCSWMTQMAEEVDLSNTINQDLAVVGYMLRHGASVIESVAPPSPMARRYGDVR